MARRFYRFSYFAPIQKGRNLRLHELRDGDAALQVASVLHDLGYQYGGLLLNRQGDPNSPVIVNDSFLQSGDLLLLTTRPPMHDAEDQRRAPRQRSYTSLEQKIFNCLEYYFAHCSGIEVNLAPSVSSRLPKELAKKQAIVFKEYGRAVCISRRGHESREQGLTTIMYMTYTRETWPSGPGLLTLFGMGGPETLVWSHLLRTKFHHLVCSRSFVMVEVKEIVPPDETSLSFADRWDARILLEIPLDAAEFAAS